MTAFKYFSAVVWLSFCINAHLVAASYQFRINLSSGSTYIQSGSGISLVEIDSVFMSIRPRPEPEIVVSSAFGPCDKQAIIRLPFSSSSCYRFSLYLHDPTGFNFHIANGCGDGWGGTFECYEVHNYKKGFYVFGKTGSGDSHRLTNVIGTWTEVRIEKGKVEFKSSEMTQTVNNPTLFTSSYVYFSMNRVYNLKAYPYPPRVGKGLCDTYIYTC